MRAAATHADVTLIESSESEANEKADHRLCVPKGDRLDESALKILLDVMAARPDAAWAAPWVRPTSAVGPMYAGPDFSLPLDLFADRPPRTVLERVAALSDVPVNNCDHPARWQELERRVSWHEHGRAGIAVPLWLSDGGGEPLPAMNAALDADRSALLLEEFIERYPKTFDRIGASLWAYLSVNCAPEPAAHRLPSEPGFRGTVWRAFKIALKKRFPRLADALRRSAARRR